jgi:hypothetical protein
MEYQLYLLLFTQLKHEIFGDQCSFPLFSRKADVPLGLRRRRHERAEWVVAFCDHFGLHKIILFQIQAPSGW